MTEAPDPYAHLAARFVAHYDTLRGLVRDELVARQVAAHLASPPARVVDVGGGAGHQSIRLARAGHDVTLVDPSDDMLERAAAALASEEPETRARLRLVRASGEEAPGVVGEAGFDGVLCHGVVMYLDDPAPLVGALAALAAPGGIVSILAKNKRALAMRPALQGRWADALAALDADRDVGGLGVTTRGDTPEGLGELLRSHDVEPVAWYGVRVLTDHLMGVPAPDDAAAVVALEWEVGRRDPYRQVGRLFNLIARRETPAGPTAAGR